MSRFQRPHLIDAMAQAEFESAGFNIAGAFRNVGINNGLC